MATGMPSRPHSRQTGSMRGSSTGTSFPLLSLTPSPQSFSTFRPRAPRLTASSSCATISTLKPRSSILLQSICANTTNRSGYGFTMVKPYPDRFVVFAQMDWSKIDDRGFSVEMVAQLDDAVRRGARGLKVLKDWGLGVRDKSGKLVPVDDPRMDPVWRECGRLGIPVAIHTSDPDAFFTPTDSSNERYEELMENPSWSFSGPGFPDKETLLLERNHVIAKHPETTFIALHVANWSENLDAVSEWLRTYPNMYVEFGAREAELGRQPRRAARFFKEFQDRILFGTDSEPVPEMYANYFRWLESEDEYFPYWDFPAQGRWEIYGMGLPDGILEKVYHGNAEKIF